MNVLVVGGSAGLGRALVARCQAQGDKVSVLDIDTATNVGATFFDIADADSVPATIVTLRGYAPFDLVAITAGVSAVGRFETLDIDRLSEVIAVNLTGPLLLTTALLKAGLIAKGGRLVLVSSLSHFVGYPGASVYAATKQGLVGFAKSIGRVARREYGVTVMVVTPGPMDTGHAERYAPPGSGRGTRTSPDSVAAAILRRRSGGIVIPGHGSKLAAIAGVLFPRFTGRMMRRLIYDRF